MAVDVKVPKIGESITEVQIGSWLVQENEPVDRDAPLVVIETDKATVEVPSPVAGTLRRVLKKAGETANVGDVIAEMEEGAGAGAGAAKAGGNGKARAPGPSPAPRESSSRTTAAEREPGRVEAAPRAEAAPRTAPSAPVTAMPSYGAGAGETTAVESENEIPHAGPAARRAMAEHGLSPDDVDGTGPGGRITRDDVLRTAQRRSEGPSRAPSPAPSPAAPAARAPGGDRTEEVVAMTSIRRRIAERLVAAQQDAALLTTFNECDMTAVMALRAEHKEAFQERYGVKLGFMSFFVKASVDALKAFPAVNAEVRGEEIVYKSYYDVGIAVGGGRGLVVPVIRDAHRLSFAAIEKTIADYGRRAKDNKLKLDELQGGTFTISNGGIYGSMLSTPIVNPPQSGILGLHAIQDRPVAHQGQVVIRPMMYLALTYDHRIVDGREAVSFLKRIKETIENPARLLLEV